MADTKISNMPAAATLTGAELLAAVQSAANVKVTADQIKTFAAVPAAASAAQTRAQTATDVYLNPASLAARSGFSANKNATNQTGIATGTATKVTFTNEIFDVGAAYDAANSLWAPGASKVWVNCAIEVDNCTSGTEAYLEVRLNNVSVAYGTANANSAGRAYPSITALVPADGNNIEIYVTGTTGGTLTVNGGNTTSYFQGWQA